MCGFAELKLGAEDKVPLRGIAFVGGLGSELPLLCESTPLGLVVRVCVA